MISRRYRSISVVLFAALAACGGTPEPAGDDLASPQASRRWTSSISRGSPPTYASVAATSLTVTWSPVTNATSYRVDRAPDVSGVAGTYVQIASTSGTSYRDSGLTAGTKYWYRLRAFNAYGSRLYSGSSSVTTAAGSVIPAALAVSPASATVGASNAQALTAAGGTAPYAWALSSNRSGGSLSATAGSGVTYKAGATGAVTDVVTLTDSTGTAVTASIAVSAPTVTVSITPGSASVTVGATQSFSCTLTATATTTCNWSVAGTGCGSVSPATGSASTTYTAPGAVATGCTVVAAAAVDTTRTASAQVTLVPVAPVVVTARNFYGHDTTYGASDSVSAAPYGGAARYVSPGGSGTACTAASPCAVTTALGPDASTAGAAQCGDTVYLRGGVYTSRVELRRMCTSARQLEVRSYPGEWAVFQTGAALPDGGVFNVWYSAYVRLQSIEFRNSYGSGTNMWTGLDLDYNDSGGHISLLNLYSHDNDGTGFRIYHSPYTYVDHCTSKNNYDAHSVNPGDNADGFGVNYGSGYSEFHNCVAMNNSDDGWDFSDYGSASHQVWDSVSYGNGFKADGTGYPSAGNGNGFKMGFPDQGPVYMYRSIALGNRGSGFDSNGSSAAGKLYNCASYNPTSQKYDVRLTPPDAPFDVRNTLSVSGGGVGDLLGSAWTGSNNAGNSFGGHAISTSDFESVDIANMNSTTTGSRFFYPKSTSTWLINQGVDVGLPFNGAKPDLGPVESQ